MSQGFWRCQTYRANVSFPGKAFPSLRGTNSASFPPRVAAGEVEEGEPGAWPRKCRTSTGLPLNVAWHRKAAKTHRCSFVKGIRWPGRAGGVCGSTGVPRPVSSPGETEKRPRLPRREGRAASLPALSRSARAQGIPGDTNSLKKADDISIKAISPPTEKSRQCSFPLLARREIPALPSQPPQRAASFVPKGQFRLHKELHFRGPEHPAPQGRSHRCLRLSSTSAPF
ncbi:uncharacterized protein LOC116992125 isoform X2 [Catharus ustulatus]|uniref:uncharacterized protein LOC116992125 isoform X2 n=1 Tax=Catharus ustulatus TaxID=91951 RepID=UPI00140BCABD|nr:uncharacterized protein LOC116992125 isoform X2 [Catharus ustulatus]